MAQLSAVDQVSGQAYPTHAMAQASKTDDNVYRLVYYFICYIVNPNKIINNKTVLMVTWGGGGGGGGAEGRRKLFSFS